MSDRKRPSDDGFQIASSHLITTCATFAAIILFTIIGANVLPGALGLAGNAGSPTSGLAVAFILNIAIILFGWRRAKELAAAMGALKLVEQEAYRNAYVDCVTGLSNRRALLKELQATLAREPVHGVLALFDLDHFKKVNDLHGHAAGDQLLAYVGGTLQEMVPDSSLVARLGGDEFAVLMPGASTEDAETLVRGVIEHLGAPVVVSGFHAHVSASTGLANLCSSLSPEAILSRADIAMYSAKRAGRNTFSWFDADQEVQLKARASFEEEIRKGIEADQFIPFFQPLVCLATGELTGFEVLARWKSPQRGLVEPVDFIDIAEATGLIAALSMNVMRKALLEAKDWPAHLKIAVNISPIQFRDPQLAERVLKMLVETGFPACRLELEITEGSLIENPEQAVTVVQSLKNNGITIALDDFGTGYASLTQLKSFPFDRIKIDKSFVGTIGESEQSAAIVRTITSLGKMLSVPITAEGVETESIRKRLAELGCEDAQGWLFGRAVSIQYIRSQFDLPEPGAAEPEQAQDNPPIHEKRDTTRRASSSRTAAATGRKW